MTISLNAYTVIYAIIQSLQLGTPYVGDSRPMQLQGGGRGVYSSHKL